MEEKTWLHELQQGDRQQGDDRIERQILDAALELFLDFGLRRTTIDQIARKAEIGRPTLYRRFADKDAVVQAVSLRESRRLIAAVASEVGGIESPEELLVQSFVLGLQKVSNHPLIERLLKTEPETLLPFMTTKAGPSIDIGHMLIGSAIQGMKDDGRINGMRTDYLLELLARLFISILLTPSQRVDAHDPVKMEQLASECLRPLLGLTPSR